MDEELKYEKWEKCLEEISKFKIKLNWQIENL